MFKLLVYHGEIRLFFLWIYGDVCFVVNQHVVLDIYYASSLKQQSIDIDIYINQAVSETTI